MRDYQRAEGISACLTTYKGCTCILSQAGRPKRNGRSGTPDCAPQQSTLVHRAKSRYAPCTAGMCVVDADIAKSHGTMTSEQRVSSKPFKADHRKSWVPSNNLLQSEARLIRTSSVQLTLMSFSSHCYGRNLITLFCSGLWAGFCQSAVLGVQLQLLDLL